MLARRRVERDQVAVANRSEHEVARRGEHAVGERALKDLEVPHLFARLRIDRLDAG